MIIFFYSRHNNFMLLSWDKQLDIVAQPTCIVDNSDKNNDTRHRKNIVNTSSLTVPANILRFEDMESINHKRNNTSSGADEDDFERFHIGDTVNVVAYSSMAIGQV